VKLGLQHVIVNFAGANDPSPIELLSGGFLPPARDGEAVERR